MARVAEMQSISASFQERKDLSSGASNCDTRWQTDKNTVSYVLLNQVKRRHLHAGFYQKLQMLTEVHRDRIASEAICDLWHPSKFDETSFKIELGDAHAAQSEISRAQTVMKNKNRNASTTPPHAGSLLGSITSNSVFVLMVATGFDRCSVGNNWSFAWTWSGLRILLHQVQQATSKRQTQTSLRMALLKTKIALIQAECQLWSLGRLDYACLLWHQLDCKIQENGIAVDIDQMEQQESVAICIWISRLSKTVL